MNGSKNKFMELAIALSEKSVAEGGGPFGAVVVRRGEVLFVHPVRNQFVCDLRAVEQPRGIRLFDFGMCHIVPFIFLSAAKVV